MWMHIVGSVPPLDFDPRLLAVLGCSSHDVPSGKTPPASLNIWWWRLQIGGVWSLITWTPMSWINTCSDGCLLICFIWQLHYVHWFIYCVNPHLWDVLSLWLDVCKCFDHNCCVIFSMQGLLRCMMRQGEFTSAQMHVDGLQMKRLPKIFTLSFLPES